MKYELIMLGGFLGAVIYIMISSRLAARKRERNFNRRVANMDWWADRD